MSSGTSIVLLSPLICRVTMIAALRPRGLSDRLEQKIAALSLRERLQEVYYVPAASLFFSCCLFVLFLLRQ
jgi:hypothetical protein